MRLILLALSLAIAPPAWAATPEALASLDGLHTWRAEPAALSYHSELPWLKRDLFESPELYERAITKAREEILQVKQGNAAYDPPEGRRIQEWATKVEAKIAEELE